MDQRYATTPGILAAQRARCAEIRGELQALEWEHVRRCNVCGADEQILVADEDRYGLALRVALCPSCGLV